MTMKFKIIKLKENISVNIAYLSTEYYLVNDILLELNKMIDWKMSHSMMLQWWCDNEDSINIINELLEKNR